MSVFVKVFDCPTFPVKIPDALRAVTRTDADGSIYFNVMFNERGSCGVYSYAYGCNALPPLEEMVKDLIVEDECGFPAINLLSNCNDCEEPIQ